MYFKVARELTSPSPFRIPITPGQLCALLRQHCDSGFTGPEQLMLLYDFLIPTGKVSISIAILLHTAAEMMFIYDIYKHIDTAITQQV